SDYLQPPAPVAIEIALVKQRAGAERHGDVEVLADFHAVETRRGDADDLERMSPERNRAAHRALGSEVRLPETVAQHRNEWAAAIIVARRDQPAGGGSHSKSAEVSTADEHAFDELHRAAARQIDLLYLARCEGSRKDVLLVTHALPDGVGEAIIARWNRAGGRLHLQLDQLLRVLHRQEAKHNGIHQTEDRRVGANSERQRKDSGGSESRRLPNLPEGVSHVCPK